MASAVNSRSVKQGSYGDLSQRVSFSRHDFDTNSGRGAWSLRSSLMRSEHALFGRVAPRLGSVLQSDTATLRAVCFTRRAAASADSR